MAHNCSIVAVLALLAGTPTCPYYGCCCLLATAISCIWSCCCCDHLSCWSFICNSSGWRVKNFDPTITLCIGSWITRSGMYRGKKSCLNLSILSLWSGVIKREAWKTNEMEYVNLPLFQVQERPQSASEASGQGRTFPKFCKSWENLVFRRLKFHATKSLARVNLAWTESTLYSLLGPS